MTSLSRRRAEEKETAERQISLQAEVITLKRKASEWGAQEDRETISSLTGRWEALSNWFPCAIVASGVTYKSVEHAFQATKAGDDADAAAAIRNAPTAEAAHQLGRKLPLPTDWERRKRAVMLGLLRDKFLRDAALRERLVRTEGKNIVATNTWGETCWGVSNGSGSNELGKALMALRTDVISGEDHAPWLAASFPPVAEADVVARLRLAVHKKGELVETLTL